MPYLGNITPLVGDRISYTPITWREESKLYFASVAQVVHLSPNNGVHDHTVRVIWEPEALAYHYTNGTYNSCNFKLVSRGTIAPGFSGIDNPLKGE